MKNDNRLCAEQYAVDPEGTPTG